MNAVDAVRIALTTKYADFSGRARRTEYWSFTVFTIALIAAGMGVDAAIGNEIVVGVISLALLLPNLAVTVRRLHDIDRSGWWLPINVVPVIGWLTMLVFTLKRGTGQSNSFGPVPQP